ncbi:MAG: CoA-transferase subunit beta [Gemmiger sp.]
MNRYTKSEIQAYTIARMIQPEQVVIVGTGLPLVGAILAKKKFQPSCTLIVESGLMDFNPIETPRSVSDLRSMTHCAVPCPPFRYLGFQANELLHDSQRLIGFIGGAAVDPYGNVSATYIGGDYHHPKTRFPGSGGANGIASFVNTIIMMVHEKRRFVEEMPYITSPGWLQGPGSREAAGLPANRGPMAVVTDLGVMKFDEQTRRMYLYGYYPSTTPEEVQANTGFALDVSRAILLEEPDEDSLRLLRTQVDPTGIFLLKD